MNQFLLKSKKCPMERGSEEVRLGANRILSVKSAVLGCGLFFGAVQAASASAAFTISLSPAGPINATLNSNITYTATVTNTGGDASYLSTTITSTLPSGMTLVPALSGSAASGFSCTGTTSLACVRTSPIAPNTPLSFPVVLTSATAGTKAVSLNLSGYYAYVWSPTALTSQTYTFSVPIYASSNTVSTVIGSGSAPTFSVSLLAPATATLNSPYAYTAKVTNTSATASTSATKLSTTLPAGLTFQASTGCTAAAQVVTCSLAAPLAGNSVTPLTINVLPTTVGTKSINANVSGGGSAGTVSSNTVSTNVNTAPAPTFAVNLAGPTAGVVNKAYAYTATVTNTSATATATAATLSTTLPAGLTFQASTGCTAAAQVVTCSLAAPLAGNSVRPVSINVLPATVGIKSVTASVSGGGSLLAVKSNAVSTDISLQPDVSVTLTQPSPALMATTMSQVEVRVSNVGGVAKAPINLTFTMPANVSAPLKFSRVADNWICKTTGQIVACSYNKDLAAGSNTRLRVPVTPAVTGVLAAPFTASVASVTNEGNTANNGPVNLTVATAVAAFVPPAAFPFAPGTSPYSYPVIDPAVITKYDLPLPNPNAPFFKHIPDTLTSPGTESYKLDIKQVDAQVLPSGFPRTKVFAYGDPTRPDTYTYPAHTIEARSTHVSNVSGLGKPVKVIYSDSRPGNTTHLVPIDHTIHGAMAGRQTNPWPAVTAQLFATGVIGADIPTGINSGVQEPDIRSVAHLHGAQIINQASDGYSEAWSSPTGQFGVATSSNPTVPFNPNPFDYSNNQEATMLWYHDHTLGMTRNNVYSGLAGLYMIRDDNEMAMINANNLPSGSYEVPLVLQDRMFKLTGELAYPDIDINTGLGTAADPSANPEFFGDVMVVNGVAWPYLQVEPRRYRFRVLNGSNARFYTLSFNVAGTTTNVPFQVIGTEGGFLNGPQTIPATGSLTIGPAERYDVIVDFSAYLGKNITVKNTANAPYGRNVLCANVPASSNTGACADPGAAPTLGTSDQIMQFRVNLPLNASVPNNAVPAVLRKPIPALVNTNPATPPHQVLLGERADAFGRVNPVLGTPTDGFLDWTSPITEQPFANTVETWEIFNSSVDAHPVHLHDGAFQVLERQAFNAILGANGTLLNICYSATVPATGQPCIPDVPIPALATENGWKETVIAYPSETYVPPGAPGEIVKGQVTRVRMKFEGTGQFVWHCHIAEHEDHDMMRAMIVH